MRFCSRAPLQNIPFKASFLPHSQDDKELELLGLYGWEDVPAPLLLLLRVYASGRLDDNYNI